MTNDFEDGFNAGYYYGRLDALEGREYRTYEQIRAELLAKLKTQKDSQSSGE